MLFTNTIIACIMSFFFLGPLFMTIGPVGQCGDIVAIVMSICFCRRRVQEQSPLSSCQPAPEMVGNTSFNTVVIGVKAESNLAHSEMDESKNISLKHSYIRQASAIGSSSLGNIDIAIDESNNISLQHSYVRQVSGIGSDHVDNPDMTLHKSRSRKVLRTGSGYLDYPAIQIAKDTE